MNIQSLMLAHFSGHFHGHGVGPVGLILFFAAIAILIWVIAAQADRPQKDPRPASTNPSPQSPQ